MIKFGKTNKGTYVAAKFSEKTLDALENFQKESNLPNPVKREDLHCTIVYSTVNIPFITSDESLEVSNGAKTKVFETQKGKRALVLALDNADHLKSRHNYGRALGATYDYPEYIPHVTVSYDIGLLDIPENEEVEIPFEVQNEYLEDLDLDWKSS